MKPPGLKISKTRFSNQDVSASQSQVFKRFFNNSNLSFSNKLEFETEERKKRVMDESLHCMFYNLPNAILDLSQLLTDLNHLYEQFYSNDDLIQGKVPTEKHKQMASLYQVIQPGLYPKGLKHFPECCPKGDTKKQCTSNVLIKTCAKHLTNKDLKHLCWNNYNLLEYSSLYPWGTVPSNQELITFGNRLRKIYIHLTQQFIKIGLGISLSYPRAEDNEDSNLTLEVLNKLLRLTALDSFDFLENYLNSRVEVVKQVGVYVHFKETQRHLFCFDQNQCLRLQIVIEELITQCSRLYDSLTKNYDKVIKMKEKTNSNTQSAVSLNFYS